MNKTAPQVWREYITSMKEGNAQWHDLLSDDVEFNGPVQQVKGKQQFIELTEGFFQMVTGVDIQRHAASENTVATESTVRVNSPKGREFIFELAEFYGVEEGKIQSVKIYYDPRDFLREFST
jgi:limonene-1,2-epoxide hydrolase